jgi:F-type H+-transporting ATPase subunit epsilon
MASMMRLEILTLERRLFDDQVEMVIVPGSEGEMGILPRHAPLLTALTYGELQVRRENEEDQFVAIGGGFMEVQPNHVIILADAAEYAEEIDLERAEAARQRAQALIEQAEEVEDLDLSKAQAALRRSLVRIEVARRRRSRRGERPSPPIE